MHVYSVSQNIVQVIRGLPFVIIGISALQSAKMIIDIIMPGLKTKTKTKTVVPCLVAESFSFFIYTFHFIAEKGQRLRSSRSFIARVSLVGLLRF